VAGVFEGVRVVDLSDGIAGPMTAMMLADNGAEVTRVEAPERAAAPLTGGERVWTRGTRNAILDLADPDDHEIVRALARRADVVLDSFRPGAAARFGLDHAALAVDNPRLISCSITAYGRLHRDRDRPADDALVAARTGLLYDEKGRRGTVMDYINRRPGPHPEFDAPEGLVRGADRAGPVFPRTPWPSIGAMYHATLGIAAALRAREVTGTGQRVETSLLQGALAAVALNWQRVAHPDAPLYWMWPADARSIEGLYQCADGRWVHHWTVRPRWVLASAEGDALGAVDLGAAYRDDPDRLGMEPEDLLTGMFLHPMLAEAFAKFPSDDWVRAGARAGTGVALVRSPAEALADESFLADGCVVEIDDPEVGRIRHIGPVLEFSATPGAVRGPAPTRGRNTADVRADASFGYQIAVPNDASADSLAHPLSGVRVIDLGLGVAGPFTGRALADLGADVIKVHAMHDSFWTGTHMGLGTNRGKRSIAMNLKDPRGRAALDALIERADVVTTNWRPGAAARLGIDFDTLHARYPRLVYCNTRGYEKGPRSDLPGTDQTAAALTGVEWEDGACDAGNPPLWPRCSMGDTGNALLAAIAIVAALYHRDRTGEGQAVSTSIVNAQLLSTSYAWIHADGTPGDWGHVDADQCGLSPYHRLYRCGDDRWIFVAVASDAHRDAFDTVVGPIEEAEKAFVTRAASDWFGALDGAGVPVEVVNEEFCRDLFDDADARAAGIVVETHAGNVGRFEDAGLLVDFSATPGIVARGPCLCGEQSREILREHGYTDNDIDTLIADKVVLALD
jgi:crotonobetainyl-CoA:carnitine CoA-transferase CaiB-like acyl-CoA transferase